MKTRLWAFSLLAAAPLLLAACGGGGAKANASDSPTTTGNANNSAFTKCLSEHGVTVPAGNGGPPGGNGAPPNGSRPDFGNGQGTPPRGSFPGGNNSKFQEAFSACRSKLPNGGNGGPGFGQNSQAFQAYTSCLKDHGVKTPSTNGSAADPGAIGRLQSDPKFAAANKTCRALLPARNGTTTTTTGS
jgi:hypothetical protein